MGEADAGKTASPEFFARSRLEEVRATLGPVVHLDLSAHQTSHSHNLLGQEVAGQVSAYIRRRVLPLGQDRLESELLSARRGEAECRHRLAYGRLPAAVREGLEAYLSSVDAWSEGARLGDLVRQTMTHLKVDRTPVRPQDLAFLLQAESSGCQTGMLRDRDGGVLLWHTEEDHDSAAGSRFDRLRLVTCAASPDSPSRRMTAFIYPDLLPGPAFGWSGRSYVHAVDAFYLKQGAGVGGVPANAVTWICLYLGGLLAPS
ncbi:MAG: hypothetical protein MUO23_13050, partial [Anaerolineales bacterium]|nr:hypothetical protein [Anaerolineales bacterium]